METRYFKKKIVNSTINTILGSCTAAKATVYEPPRVDQALNYKQVWKF